MTFPQLLKVHFDGALFIWYKTRTLTALYPNTLEESMSSFFLALPGGNADPAFVMLIGIGAGIAIVTVIRLFNR